MTFSEAETALLIAGLRMLQRCGPDAEELVILESADVELETLDEDVDALVERLQFEDEEDG